MSETVKLEYKVKVLYKEKEYDLQELFDYLVEQLEQKDNIIKEVREFAINNTVRGLYELLDEENE